MSPTGMLILLGVALAIFAFSARRRWRLMRIGQSASRSGDWTDRVKGLLTFGFYQQRMRRYPAAGIAHMLIFLGFLVLLVRSLILFGRGFHEQFDLFIFAQGTVIGNVYSLCKDVFIALVLIGTVIFLHFRLIKKLPRLTHNFDGIVILGIIAVMMCGDLLYDGAGLVRDARANDHGLTFAASAPAASLSAFVMRGVPASTLRVLEHIGFWVHTGLVLVFLNILPYSKHFHVITALPNIFLRDSAPPGRLPSIEDIEGRLEREETLGVATIKDLTWKGILDLYTCTECGRCSDHCPASTTGKLLSPKHLTVALRDHLYKDEKDLLGGNGAQAAGLVPDIINPEVLWACTTCRACETECPVFITYVDKIVDMRRHLVMEKAEFPEQLQNAFQGLERDGNPWSFQAADRAGWADGLDIPIMAELGENKPEYLMWVGCAPSFDERAKKVSRATARLLQAAGVEFAILGMEETCNGDPARRAGNEYLFQMMARTNIEVLNGYGVKKIVTTCPHCYNTLKNEYPDFGGNYQVVHHTELLAELVKQGKLRPERKVERSVVFHDSCYLGRYNEVYDPPRDILRRIPGLTVVEAEQTRDRGMCCGAGGAQMFKEEEPGKKRVNHERTDQLLAARSDVVSSACPFCMRMLTDGLADKERQDVQQLDVAEMLWQSVSEAVREAPEPATAKG